MRAGRATWQIQRSGPPASLSSAVKREPARPEMRKPIVVVALLVVFGCVVAASLVLASRPAMPLPLTLSFYGRDPSVPYRAAGFCVTNCGRQPISMRRAEVQTRVDGAWKSISVEMPPDVSRWLKEGEQFDPDMFSSILVAGQHRSIVVHWPEEKSWRVCLVCVREIKGLKLLAARAQLAWRFRNTPSPFPGSI
jgi:hypothetical protein